MSYIYRQRRICPLGPIGLDPLPIGTVAFGYLHALCIAFRRQHFSLHSKAPQPVDFRANFGKAGRFAEAVESVGIGCKERIHASQFPGILFGPLVALFLLWATRRACLS